MCFLIHVTATIFLDGAEVSDLTDLRKRLQPVLTKSATLNDRGGVRSSA